MGRITRLRRRKSAQPDLREFLLIGATSFVDSARVQNQSGGPLAMLGLVPGEVFPPRNVQGPGRASVSTRLQDGETKVHWEIFAERGPMQLRRRGAP
jgi:hypothetical protein